MKIGWYGVDLDATLATYERGQWPMIGTPVPAMVERVKQMLAEGKEVRIMTARVSPLYLHDVSREDWEDAQTQLKMIKHWCKEHIGVELRVTAVKDYEMIEIYDDRAITVEKNTGRILTALLEMTI